MHGLIGYKQTLSHRVKSSLSRSGDKAYQWKGDNVGYRVLHKWVRKHKGEARKCERCGKRKTTPKSIHWANKSHKYLRQLDDWIALCWYCHRKHDNLPY